MSLESCLENRHNSRYAEWYRSWTEEPESFVSSPGSVAHVPPLLAGDQHPSTLHEDCQDYHTPAHRPVHITMSHDHHVTVT